MTNEQIQALKAAAESQAGILENIAGYEPHDIDGDDVELRFETEDGFDTGCNVSIVEQCQKSADVIRSLLASHEADKALIAELQSCGRIEYTRRLERQLAELEARTLTVNLPCERFAYGESDYDDGHARGWNAHKIEAEKALREACAAAGITLVVGGDKS